MANLFVARDGETSSSVEGDVSGHDRREEGVPIKHLSGWVAHRRSRLRNLLPEYLDLGQAIKDGKNKAMVVSATTNDALSVDQARALLDAIFAYNGLTSSSPHEQLLLFCKGMDLCYALNSASVRNPDRATFNVYIGASTTPQGRDAYEGVVTYNYFHDVQSVLKGETRRFFRARADSVRAVLKEYLDPKIPLTTTVEWENRASILRIAQAKGLTRWPDLIHDSADACSELTQAEYLAVMASKSIIIAASDQSVDDVVVPGAGAARAVGGGYHVRSENMKSGPAVAAPDY